MSSTWLDGGEAESIESYGGDEGEDYPEGMNGDGEAFAEGDDDAEFSWRRRRARRVARARARQRRRALARGRYAGRAVGAPTTAAAVRRTEADVANLEVESQVQADAVGSTLAAHRRQLRASTDAAAAGAVVPALLGFLKTRAPEIGGNKYLNAGLPLAPLLLLKPTQRGLSDRRLWAAAAVAGLTIADDLKTRSQEPEGLTVNKAVSTLPEGIKAIKFPAFAVDRAGKQVPLPPGAKIEWKSEPDGVFTVNPDGSVDVTGKKDQAATITATLRSADGKELGKDFVTVTVVKGSTATP